MPARRKPSRQGDCDAVTELQSGHHGLIVVVGSPSGITHRRSELPMWSATTHGRCCTPISRPWQARCWVPMATLPVVDYAKQVNVTRLVFEVWPGTWFEDMCVSGIRLESEFDQKPKITRRGGASGFLSSVCPGVSFLPSLSPLRRFGRRLCSGHEALNMDRMDLGLRVGYHLGQRRRICRQGRRAGKRRCARV